MNNKKAFTLLEVLLVVAIIASLAIIIIIRLNPEERLNESEYAERLAQSVDLKKAIDSYIVSNRNYPENIADLPTTYGIYDICKTGQSTDCVNLDELVDGGYIGSIPVDAYNDTSAITGYKLEYKPAEKDVLIYTYDDYMDYVQTGKSLNNNLVGYWKFEDNAVDSSENNLTLTSRNSITWNAGRYGRSFLSDAGQFYRADNSLFDNTQNLTVSVWLNRDNAASWQRIVGKYYYSGVENGSWLIWFNGTNNIAFTINNGSTMASIVSSQTVPLDTWVHVVATYDGSKLKIYYNGVLSATGTSAGSIPDTPYCLTFGYTANTDCNTGAQNGLDGQTDDVRIYRRTLNAEEVLALYNYAPPAVGQWKFDEGTGTSVADSSGNNLAATLMGGGSWTTGKYTNAISFNGSNSYVTIPDNSILEPNRVTITAWFKTSNATAGYLITKRDDNYYVQIGSGGKVMVWMTPPCAAWLATNKVVNDNNWHFMATTYDGVNKDIYIDGVLDTTAACTGANLGSGTNNVDIGRRYDGASGVGYFNGQIDDVRIYNYGMNATQVTRAYNNEL